MELEGIPILAFKNKDFLIYDETVSEEDLVDFKKSDKSYLETNNTSTSLMYYEQKTIHIYEWTNYKIESFKGNLKKSDFYQIGDFFNNKYGTLYFKNTIGKFYFKNILLTLHSHKISIDDYFNLVETINNYIFNLSYDYNRKGSLSVLRNNKKKTDISYHVFLLVYHALTTNTPNNNLLTQFNCIEHAPLKKIVTIENDREISEIQDLSEDELIEIFSSNAQYIKCNNPNNKLAKKISKNQNNYLPHYINSTEDEFSFDTNENQFLKYFISYILELLTYFENLFKNDSTFANFELLENTTKLKNKLNRIITLSFLRNVSDLKYLNLNSPVLQKREGYRQFFNLFLHLKSLPEISMSETASELIESKSIDVIYENYCFFKLASILSELYKKPLKSLKFKFIQTDFSKTLEKKTYSNYFEFEDNNLPKIQLHYNKNYTNSDHECYSKAYDPDISIEIYEDDTIKYIYIFDAKFKITTYEDYDDQKQYFKYDDISKMHTYKDAIIKTIGAYVLYPGTEQKLYKDTRNAKFKYNGVGAFPLNPNNLQDESNLYNILKDILEQQFA